MSKSSPWAHFSLDELACRCGCGLMNMNADFMEKMEKLRLHYGRPMAASSGTRCSVHNQKVSTTGPNGPHTTGHALDIGIYGVDALELVEKAFDIGVGPGKAFTGIGINQKGPVDGRFIHFDDLTAAEAKVRPHIWTY